MIHKGCKELRKIFILIVVFLILIAFLKFIFQIDVYAYLRGVWKVWFTENGFILSFILSPLVLVIVVAVIAIVDAGRLKGGGAMIAASLYVGTLVFFYYIFISVSMFSIQGAYAKTWLEYLSHLDKPFYTDISHTRIPLTALLFASLPLTLLLSPIYSKLEKSKEFAWFIICYLAVSIVVVLSSFAVSLLVGIVTIFITGLGLPSASYLLFRRAKSRKDAYLKHFLTVFLPYCCMIFLIFLVLSSSTYLKYFSSWSLLSYSIFLSLPSSIIASMVRGNRRKMLIVSVATLSIILYSLSPMLINPETIPSISYLRGSSLAGYSGYEFPFPVELFYLTNPDIPPGGVREIAEEYFDVLRGYGEKIYMLNQDIKDGIISSSINIVSFERKEIDNLKNYEEILERKIESYYHLLGNYTADLLLTSLGNDIISVKDILILWNAYKEGGGTAKSIEEGLKRVVEERVKRGLGLTTIEKLVTLTGEFNFYWDFINDLRKQSIQPPSTVPPIDEEQLRREIFNSLYPHAGLLTEITNAKLRLIVSKLEPYKSMSYNKLNRFHQVYFTELKNISVPEKPLLKLEVVTVPYYTTGYHAEIHYYYNLMDISYTDYGWDLEPKLARVSMSFPTMVSKTRMFETAFIEIMFGQFILLWFAIMSILMLLTIFTIARKRSNRKMRMSIKET